MWYAQIDQAEIVIGLASLAGEVTSASLVPIDHEDAGLLGQRWDGAAFAPVSEPQKPRLRVTATQTRIWELTPGGTPEADQVTMLTGVLLDESGQPDPTMSLPETLIEVPSASGQPALVLIRATAGVVEISIRGQWSPSIPFATEHSGRYDVATLLGAYFDVVDGPVIEVLRG
ncbi:MAG: hypothetical protein HYY11_01230 [Candidatus Methylomirabilis oxyfera]|nr:hypothetical protein [Candidatus Methylomirabilis oxyfera]